MAKKLFMAQKTKRGKIKSGRMKPLLIILISLSAIIGYQIIISHPATAQIQNHLPANPYKQFYEREVIATAYSLSPDETDSNPCVSASGRNLCLYPTNYVAYNFASYGTAIEYNGRIYQVFDHTSKKYAGRLDILMDTKQEAINFGKQKILIKIYY